MSSIEQFLQDLIPLAAEYLPKVLLAIVTLIVGWWVVSGLSKLIAKGVDKKGADESVTRFVKNLSKIILQILLILSVVSMVGIETTSFVAVLAAMGFAIGLALQGSLSNFAGGVLILILKPFRVGDYIESQSFAGTVERIDIIYTVLKTPDNTKIVLPNGDVANQPIQNYTSEDTRRIEWVIGIDYSDDIKKAREHIKKLIDADDRILGDPEPMIAVAELGDSSVNFKVRVWVKTSDFWGTYFDMIEKVKYEFDENGISFPFPQRDVHLFQEKN